MADSNTNSIKAENKETTETEKKYCGIIMPITDMDDFRNGHWNDVRRIIEDVIRDCNYIPRLVSDSVDTRVIHDNIVNNIYKDEIIVCDISGRNANVMFELGMRLAFNKPVIVVKDHETPFAFDTGILFQEPYPRDLRFTEIEDFKQKLKSRILGTVNAIGKPDTKSFLDNFGSFNVEEIKDKDITIKEYFSLLSKEIKDLKFQINSSADIKPKIDYQSLDFLTQPSTIRKLVRGYLQEKNLTIDVLKVSNAGLDILQYYQEQSIIPKLLSQAETNSIIMNLTAFINQQKKATIKQL